MKIALGAPVAERAWILPRWLKCLSKQDLQPDYLRFVYSPSVDDTLDILLNQAPEYGYGVEVYATKLPFFSREQRNGNPGDPWRAAHLSRLRNRLRALFLATDADICISLDTDILLEGPRILEELVDTVASTDWDLIAGRTSLVAGQYPCYNVGWFNNTEPPGSFEEGWTRADDNALAYRSPLAIDIPMAFWAAKRFTVGMCKYRAHAQGEDIGFAQSLRERKMHCGWRYDLVGRHVWGPSYLEQTNG